MRASCVALMLAGCLWGSSASAQTTNAALAQTRYEAGVEQFHQGNFDRALIEFQASLELYASPNSRLFIARTLRALNRLDEASLTFEFAARDAEDRIASDPRYRETAAAARSEMAEIEPQLARIVLRGESLPTGTEVRIGDHVVPAAVLGVRFPVMPGTYVVHATAHGFHPFEQRITLEAGGAREIGIALLLERASGSPSLAPIEIAPSPRFDRRLAFISGGVAALGLGVTLGFYFAANGEASAFLAQPCPTGGTCPDAQVHADRGLAFQVASNVGLWTTITAALVTGALVIFLPAPGASSRTRAHAVYPTAQGLVF